MSSIAHIFDPLGLLLAVTTTAKILLQELWKLKLSWDESIPLNLHTTWTTYYTQLTKLNELKIPRHVICPNPVTVELHGFSDASSFAYGACVFIRSLDSSGQYYCNILIVKTRVAPPKQITIPRLELCAALLLAELVDKVKQSMQIDFNQIYYWCDSTIVIAWIKMSPSLLKTFIANRISQIQTWTLSKSWHYINTLENPADLLSRGISPSDLLNSNIWFHGPSWLSCSNDQWPNYTNITKEVQDIPELRTVLETDTNKLLEAIKNCSSLLKLQRIFAYVLRFVNNTLTNKQSKNLNCLLPSELDDSLNCLIRVVQQESFTTDHNGPL